MKKEKYLMLIMLICIASIFTSSCVQVDMYDEFYDESYGWFPLRKKGKDINGGYPKDLIAATSFVNNETFYPNYNECMAASLYYYCSLNGISGYNTPYKMRETISKKVYGNIVEWPIYYRNAVCFDGGISLDDYNENQIMNEIAGISWHSSIMLGDIFGKMVCGFNDNHFALVLSLRPYPSGVIDFQVQDQTGCHDISASYVDSYYY